MSITNIISLRILSKSSNLWYPVGSVLSNTNVGLNGSQSVRWKKPRHLPKAPSKLYLVTQRKRLPKDETQEVLRLYDNYRCYQRLMQNHMMKENEIHEEFGKLSQAAVEKEEEEHRQLMEYNRQENERMAQKRIEMMEIERKEMMKSILAFKAAEEEKELKDIEASYQRLKDTQELAKLFIEREHLEKAVSDAIDNPIDFNFAVDVNGRKYEGRWTQPHKVDLDSLPVLPVKDEGLTNIF